MRRIINCRVRSNVFFHSENIVAKNKDRNYELLVEVKFDLRLFLNLKQIIFEIIQVLNLTNFNR